MSIELDIALYIYTVYKIQGTFFLKIFAYFFSPRSFDSHQVQVLKIIDVFKKLLISYKLDSQI